MTFLEEAYQKYAEWLLKLANKNGDCIECHFVTGPRQYPRLTGGGKAHRFIWETFKGPIPEGIWVLHTCDNRKCINIDHLFLGTRQDNVDDMVAKGRHKSERPRMLTLEDEIEMHQLRSEGWSYDRLASKYLVTKQTIYKYIKGERGSHASES